MLLIAYLGLVPHLQTLAPVAAQGADVDEVEGAEVELVVGVADALVLGVGLV